MSTTIDEVMDTVREARHRGPEALAALALCYGADAVGWMIRHAALRRELLDTERGMDEAREALAAQDSAPDLDYPARAEVWKLREAVEALRARAEKAEAERGRAVQEREAFSLRLSAAERERDEARARVEAIAVERNAIVSELSQTTDAMMQARAERDALRARPTYEARTAAPTPEERVAHDAAGARWLRCGSGRAHVVCVYRTTDTGSLDGLLWIPLGADGLPCAWPVAP